MNRNARAIAHEWLGVVPPEMAARIYYHIERSRAVSLPDFETLKMLRTLAARPSLRSRRDAQKTARLQPSGGR